MYDAGWKEARFRRDRAIVMILLALILGGLLFYMVTVVSTAREWRRHNAQELNTNTARLSARLLEEQCENALDVLSSLARSSLLGTLPQKKYGTVKTERYLREAVELVPDLMATAVYDTHGNRIAKYPQAISFPATATSEAWFQQVNDTHEPTIGNITGLHDGSQVAAFTIAIPIGTPAKETHYLVASYRLSNSARWLRGIRLAGGIVLLSDAQGNVVMASDPGTTVKHLPTGYPALGKAMQGTDGAMLIPHPITGTPAVVGYALFRQPRLAVLVVQPVVNAFAPTDYLLQRIFGVTVPLVVLAPLAAWNLLNLYHRGQLLARRLSERNEHLKRSAQIKAELLANVSHDLKTPIASMQLSLSGIQDAEKRTVPPAVQECLSLCHEELSQLASRVRNLLDMSRLDADELVRLREPCDLTDIVAGVLERLRLILRNRPLHASFPAEPLLLECDPMQLETVIVNLIENAVKYSPAATAIYLSGSAAGDSIVFRLRDEGPGIPAEEKERIFDKFFRLGTRHASGGTGLGLAICKTIIEAHGGTIRVDNATEGGAIFSVVLPRVTEDLDGGH